MLCNSIHGQETFGISDTITLFRVKMQCAKQAFLFSCKSWPSGITKLMIKIMSLVHLAAGEWNIVQQNTTTSTVRVCSGGNGLFCKMLLTEFSMAAKHLHLVIRKKLF